jgi:predicted RNA binding protein YcfA (HicA-like mRNA interferase family)
MPKPPLVSGKETARALQRLGFVFIRQKGSHAVLRRDTPDGAKGCVVPMHPEIQPGTLRGILKQAGVSVEDFTEQL